MNRIIIVGGGAAGLMAAVTAAENGASVTLLERNEKLGKKIYITGKGRCNVTNHCPPEEFRRNVAHNPRFLYSALETLPPEAFMAQLESMGCPLETERGNRVFPVSQKASDVTRAFERRLRTLGVKTYLNTRVRSLLVENGRVCGVETERGERLSADGVIVCTGGASYPSTGSTGDGYALLKACGHTVFPPLPSLIPLTCGDRWVTELQGLALKNVRLTLTRGKKTLYTELGEMLFTHFGVSGPLVLSTSCYMTDLEPSECVLAVDLKPALSEKQLEERILRDVSAAGKKRVGTILAGLYPARLADVMAQLCGIDAAKPANELRKDEREALIAKTKALVLPVTGTLAVDAAIVTRGGVDVKQINPATMESKVVEGLFVAGELLDVDAMTGGFNLQIAFSTGKCAGQAAAEDKEKTADS